MCIIKNATLDNIDQAMRITNEVFTGNIKLNRFAMIGKRFIVTLTVKSSRNDGARRGYDGRRISAACWHVYGVFYDALLSVNPTIEIKTTGRTNPVTINDHKWQDRNIGSIICPMMYSDACECEDNYILMNRINKIRRG